MGQSTILKAIHNKDVAIITAGVPVNYGAKYNLESNSQLAIKNKSVSLPVNYGAKYNLESNSQPVVAVHLRLVPVNYGAKYNLESNSQHALGLANVQNACELWGKVQS